MSRYAEIRRAEYDNNPFGGVVSLDVIRINGCWLDLPQVLERCQPLPEAKLQFLSETICETCRGHKRVTVPAPGRTNGVPNTVDLPWCPDCCQEDDPFEFRIGGVKLDRPLPTVKFADAVRRLLLKQHGQRSFDPTWWTRELVLQLGAVPEPRDMIRHPKGGDMTEWPEDLQVREVPS